MKDNDDEFDDEEYEDDFICEDAEGTGLGHYDSDISQAGMPNRKIRVDIVPDDPKHPYKSARMMIFNIHNDIPEKVAIAALEDCIYKYNPMNMDVDKFDAGAFDDFITRHRERFNIPVNLQELFSKLEIEPSKQDNYIIDTSVMPELYGLIDEEDYFRFIDLTKSEVAKSVVAHNPAYALAKYVIKGGMIVYKLYVGPRFEIEPEDDGEFAVIISEVENVINFKPVRRNKNGKDCSK